MNFSTFNSLLNPVWNASLPKNLSDAADSIANAYHLSNIGQTTTIYAAPLLSANKSTLKTFLELGLSINFYGSQIQSTIGVITSLLRSSIGSPAKLESAIPIIYSSATSLISSLPGPIAFIGATITPLINTVISELRTHPEGSEKSTNMIDALAGTIASLDVSKISYLVIATGICLYWITAKMSPVPPMPPCISPTGGTLILFPGLPIPLNSALSDSFKSGQSTTEAIAKLYNVFILHQFTVAGVYTGIIPFFPTPVPSPPLPWFSLLNIPMPVFKLPTVLDANGDGKKDKSSSSKSSGTPTTTITGSKTGVPTQTGSGTQSGSQTTGSQATGSTQPSSQSGSPSSSSSNTSVASSTQSNPNYNNLSSELTAGLSSSLADSIKSNQFGIHVSTSDTLPSYLNLIVELRESVNVLNSGENEYQFSITAKLNNTAQDLMLNGAPRGLPVTIGDSTMYTFKDTIESQSSIYRDSIDSPRERAIQLMKQPLESAIKSVLGTPLKRYIDKWYGGKMPVELNSMVVYTTTSIPDSSQNTLGRRFIPFDKFNSLH